MLLRSDELFILRPEGLISFFQTGRNMLLLHSRVSLCSPS
uniref:Uncharacterized protein n=1 Tax=Picea glauca TaxID=3330 RepID=A0A101M5A7_PICGL|nr:hypothetical protein ABT39_MTgene998 [Picea glauca]